MLHKCLFAEGMTGRRTFITNLNEESSEIGMRENMKWTGHARIQTHLGYQKDRQTGKNSKRKSLFGVTKINQSKVPQMKEKRRLRNDKIHYYQEYTDKNQLTGKERRMKTGMEFCAVCEGKDYNELADLVKNRR